MYRSGATTGMATIAALLRPIRKDLIVALSALTVAGVGGTMLGVVVALTAAAAALTPTATTLGSACASPSDNSLSLLNNPKPAKPVET